MYVYIVYNSKKWKIFILSANLKNGQTHSNNSFECV